MKSAVMKKVTNAEELKALLDEAGLSSSDNYVVKLNWFFQGKGFYTDAKTLQLLLECLNNVTVVEAYTYARNDGTRKITADNVRESWHWIREQDRKFLRETGLGSLLKEYDVEYVNITEEAWSNRVANAENVRRLVEAKYASVMRKELYEQVPRCIYDLRGRKLISFSKLKQQRSNRISATLKNLFGLIPDPDRRAWHGEKDRDLAQSIVDVNKVYWSLFETIGLCEMIYAAIRYVEDGAYSLPWGYRYDLIENLGLAVCGRNLVSVDAYVSQLFGIDPQKVEHINLAAKVFGRWPQEIVAEAIQRRIPL